MSRFEDYPHRCVKCGATNLELYKFTYTKSKGTFLKDEFSSSYINFPVCADCKQEFEKSIKLENAAHSMRCITAISLLLTISFAYTLFIGISLDWYLILLLIIASASSIVGVTLILRTKLDKNRIQNYINLKSTGELKIQDKELEKEVAEHIYIKKAEEILKESKGIGTITCPKCGSQQIEGTDYCKACGKELRFL